MSTVRAGQPGATRVCPHCKAIVLESASICPGCRHHLRFNNGTQLVAGDGYCAFNVDGTIAHRVPGEQCEYCVVLDIRNERGEQLLRQVVGVGALQAGELRRLNVTVEMLPVVSQSVARAQSAAGQPATPPAGAGLTGVRTPGAAAAAPAPATAGNRTGAGRSPAPTNPTSPSPVNTGGPAPARAATPPAASGPPKLTPPVPGAPAPSGAPTQRLRIFRKP
jgi:hypothetical protein